MLITLNVTQRNIDDGCANDGNNCPIAKAWGDVMGGGLVDVGSTYVRWRESIQAEDYRLRLPLPMNAMWFVRAFDRYHEESNLYADSVKPFSFELEIEDALIEKHFPHLLLPLAVAEPVTEKEAACQPI